MDELTLMSSMTPQQSAAFQHEVSQERKNPSVAMLLAFFFGLHYAYLGRWGLQVLFWCTLGGIGLWWLVDIFRAQGLARRYNGEVAEKAATKVKALFPVLALALLALPLSAQVFDPDPAEPSAQHNAEFRAMAACLGLAAPPIGWSCTPLVNGAPNGMFYFSMACEPDSMLIDQQERERQEWERRQVQNARRNSRSRR
jgi:TM2 domain-containing membrane protein YozV